MLSVSLLSRFISVFHEAKIRFFIFDQSLGHRPIITQEAEVGRL